MRRGRRGGRGRREKRKERDVGSVKRVMNEHSLVTKLSCVAEQTHVQSYCPSLVPMPCPGNEVSVLPSRPGIQPETLQRKFVRHGQCQEMPLHGPEWSYDDHRIVLFPCE